MNFRQVILCAVFLCPQFLFAEEGMFLFTNPPKQLVLDKYGFEITDAWLDKVQKASLRFPGGSGSFVSPNGLILTNHHVAAGQLQMLSTAEKDLLADGFLAKTLEEELPCKSLELLALQSIEDVTERVKAAVKPEMALKFADKARKNVISQIEAESFKNTGLKSDVVTLYQGGQYHLYRYKKYTDVRLVFAPEQQAGAFGGDPDNFEYPRYCLDCTFFRAYEDGKPANTPIYFSWAKENVKDGELVFVSGHPGRTNRAYTLAHLMFQRDFLLPRMMQRLYRLETLYSIYADKSEENRRRIKNDLDGVKNSRKVRLGQQAGLFDPDLMARKYHEQENFLFDVKNNEQLSKEINSRIDPEAIFRTWASLYQMYSFLEQGDAFPARTFRIARTIVRLTDELEKPNDERLPEYQDVNIESLKRSLFSGAPIYEDVEILKMSNGLTFFCESATDIGREAGIVINAVMKDRSPSKRATELVKGTKLFDVDERKRLVEGGKKAVDESTDPMILLAKEVDAQARIIRTLYETEVSEPLKQLYEKLADSKFQLYGDSMYPDATFSLRLSYGTVKGYTEDDGTAIPPWTEMGGLFERAAQHKNVPPYDVPESWAKVKDKIALNTPFNLVSTNDIIGGNSGSPLLNAKAEVVGLIFDGNVQSLSSDMIYTDTQSRSVSVHAAGILEAIKSVYRAENLLKELRGE